MGYDPGERCQYPPHNGQVVTRVPRLCGHPLTGAESSSDPFVFFTLGDWGLVGPQQVKHVYAMWVDGPVVVRRLLLMEIQACWMGWHSGRI